MKIVHICQYWNDEYSYQENILPEYHQKMGHDVVVLTSEYSNFLPKKKVGEYTERNYRYIRLKTKWNFQNRFVKFEDLKQAIEIEKPDFIFFHGTYSPDLKTIIKYKIKTNCKLVVDNHADLENSGKNKVWKKLYYEIFQTLFHKKNVKYIDKYFGTTPKRVEFLKENIKISQDKIELLPIGADLDMLDKIQNSHFKLKEKIPENIKIISFGGKITNNKGFLDVINIFLKLRRKNIKLIIFGKIIDKEILNLVKENEDKLVYLEWQNRVETLQILKQSLFTVWPRLHTTLIEDSISVGTPVICFKNSNTEHLVCDFLDDDSISALVEAMERLIDNKEYYNDLKNRTIKYSKKLSYHEIAKISLNLKEKNIFKKSIEKE